MTSSHDPSLDISELQSEEDSLPKGIGDSSGIKTVVSFLSSEEDSLPKGIGDRLS